MTKRQWMVLLMLFLTYLLLGASIFYHIESRLEIEKVEQTRNERIEINGKLFTIKSFIINQIIDQSC